MKSTEGIRKYSPAELMAIIPDDRWAARDEAIRRHNKLAAKIAELQKLDAELLAVYNAAK